MWKKNLARFNAIQGTSVPLRPVLMLLAMLLAVPAAMSISAVAQVVVPGGNNTAADNSKDSNLKFAAKAVRMENYGQAFKLYSIAAQNGDAEAQFQLANLYRLGRGVGADSARELYWLEKAVAGNHVGAQYSLALKIQKEQPQRAGTLMQSAAAAGFSPAQTYLQRMGDATQVNDSDQLSLEEQWFVAARKNQLERLRTLRPQISGVDMPDPQQRTALAVAVQAGDTEAVAWLLKQGANPGKADRFGKSPAFIAIDTKQTRILNQLFAAGLSPGVTLPNGDTLLHYTIRRNWDKRREQTDVLKLLIDKKVAVNQRNTDGWTALDLAVFAGADAEGSAQMLVRHGAQHGDSWLADSTLGARGKPLNAQASQWTGNPAVDVAQLAKIVSAGNAKLLRKLASAHPQLVNQPLADGSTLLGTAIINGQQPVVDALLDLGASVDTPVNGHLTALPFAAQLGRGTIAVALLTRGAKWVSADTADDDAIELALLSGHADLAKALLDQLTADSSRARLLPVDRYAYTAARADETEFVQHIGPRLRQPYRDQRRRTALWYAASHGNADMVAVLIRYGVGEDTPDNDGKSPLLVAAEMGCLSCVDRLAKTADLNRQTPSGNSALMIAAGRADADLANWLIANGADVHLRNSQGDTALIVAVKAEAASISQQLVTAGASVSRKNKMGLSARDIAEQKGPALSAALLSK